MRPYKEIMESGKVWEISGRFDKTARLRYVFRDVWRK